MLHALSSAQVDVTCLGILTADVIARPLDGPPTPGQLTLMESVSLCGGGCALNTATALAHLGIETAVVGKVGCDAFGDFLVRTIDERALHGAGVLRDAEAPTSASVVLVDRLGERTFLHVTGANGTLRAGDLDVDALCAGRALHVGGALVLPQLDGEPTARLLAAARARGVMTSLDPVYDPTGRWERLLPSLPHLDLLAPGLEEARALSGLHDPAEAARWLHERGAAEVAVTLGPDGCHVVADGIDEHIPPHPVAAVDGTGAGDAFVAALLFARLAGHDLRTAARMANVAGAHAATAIGASTALLDAERLHALAHPTLT